MLLSIQTVIVVSLKGRIHSRCLRISIAQCLKRDFGLRKEKVLLKLRLVETYLKHCFSYNHNFFIFLIIKIN